MNQLRQQGAENRYEDVLKELPRVREDLGFPPW
jgi:oxaloacetate decarboxylase alpha subunit